MRYPATSLAYCQHLICTDKIASEQTYADLWGLNQKVARGGDEQRIHERRLTQPWPSDMISGRLVLADGEDGDGVNASAPRRHLNKQS